MLGIEHISPPSGPRGALPPGSAKRTVGDDDAVLRTTDTVGRRRAWGLTVARI